MNGGSGTIMPPPRGRRGGSGGAGAGGRNRVSKGIMVLAGRYCRTYTINRRQGVSCILIVADNEYCFLVCPVGLCSAETEHRDNALTLFQRSSAS